MCRTPDEAQPNVTTFCVSIGLTFLLRRERQLEGIAKAKAAGVYKGRPPSIEALRVRELKAQGMRPQ
jgi:hypothetical protein